MFNLKGIKAVAFSSPQKSHN